MSPIFTTFLVVVYPSEQQIDLFTTLDKGFAIPLGNGSKTDNIWWRFPNFMKSSNFGHDDLPLEK
ncbi:MAG: hypothetical protein EA409_11445 [Saprospirales bacterium]|nr:MAG: hypothetical protein EA409_11445 [Saprospirales bacterium]